MIALFKPAVFVINRLKYLQKFLLISVLFSLPLGLALFFFLAEINAQIALAAKERIGLEYIGATRELICHLQDYRDADFASRNGTNTFTLPTEMASKQIVHDMRTLDAVDARIGKTLDVSEAWQQWKANWIRL